ncbi:MAG: exonuclease domain-containing protein [Ferrimicrobium sp.]
MDALATALAFDLETTGVDPFFDQPVSYALIDDNAGKSTIEHQLVQPEVAISPGAQDKHGITAEQLRAEGIDLATALERIRDRLIAAGSAGIPVVGMNLSFDLTIIDHQLRTHLGAGLTEMGWNGPIVDAFVLDREFDKYRKGKRTLNDLCHHYGVVLEGAHDAADDAVASLQVARAVFAKYPDLAAVPLDELLARQANWHIARQAGYNEWRISQQMSPIRIPLSWPIDHRGDDEPLPMPPR